MWFRFSRPDYFYLGRYYVLDASDGSPFNRGWSQGFGFFVLHCRWNAGRSVAGDGIHYPAVSAYRVVINGTEWCLASEFTTYERVLAFTHARHGATVTWYDKKGAGGTLMPGDRVLLTDGMVFNAVTTEAA